MLNRILRAARLDRTLYDELRDDPAATLQALAIVVLAGIAWGIAWTAVPGHVYLSVPAITADNAAFVSGVSWPWTCGRW